MTTEVCEDEEYSKIKETLLLWQFTGTPFIHHLISHPYFPLWA